METSSKYKIGDAVMVADENPTGNPRTPHYIRGKRGIIGNRIQAGEGFDKNIPSQVLRGIYIFRDPQAQGIDSPGVLMIESGKRLPVARFRAG